MKPFNNRNMETLCSTYIDITLAATQESILGGLLFDIFMVDFLHVIGKVNVFDRANNDYSVEKVRTRSLLM